MMMRVLIIAIVCVLVLLPDNVSAQKRSGVELLKDMYQKIEQATNYQYGVTIKVYSTTNSNEPVYNVNSITVKSKDVYYVTIMGKTTIITDTYSLMVDDMQQLIMYRSYASKPSDIQNTEKASSAFLNMDTVLKRNDIKVEVLKDDDIVSIFKIINPGNGVSSIKIVFDKQHNFIKRMEYAYNAETQKETGNSILIIDYRKLQQTQMVDEKKFEVKNYISRNKNVWEGVKKYQNYKVVDQTNLKF